MEQFWQFILDFSANHIARYGFYIPGEQYTLVLWNELLVIILSFALVILLLKVRGLKRRLARVPGEAARPRVDPVRMKPVRMYHGADEVLGAIEKAMERGLNVHIWYSDAEGEVTDRVVEPLRVYRMRSRLYLQGYCHLRRDSRDFRLDRIIHIKPVDYAYILKDTGGDVIQTLLDDNLT